MAIKKSELYSSLWQACNDLRGGMDASQYKDYILVFLFIKYVSDKYAGTDVGDIEIPEGASFTDMVKFKGNPEVGDLINKKIIDPLATASNLNRAELPDFNDSTKLGDGQEKVERLTNLIAIFENPALDFSSNKADGDDILGDAYEYLMRHFATESGKSKGQFYTPAEVSRIMARLIGIDQAATTESTTVYDPTCGSGSLLLRIASAANTNVSLYGQEKDSSTSGLARMNMILHNNSTAEIVQGNTLATPKFVDANGQLQTFDYVVANPPFSDKKWTTGVNVDADPFGRFDVFGVPPHKQGDYAYLLHIIRSMKPTGKAACILPHGVLFRGNAEATIRTELLKHGYIKAVIGLPANLFYGTGIPACIIVLDKENAQARKGVVMIDASKGFIKDGAKNRLRERDIHQIVDTYVKQDFSNPRYARLVGLDEIARNGFNLNIPRYIDSSEPEDLQDIEAHLEGGVPVADIDQLAAYWTVYPTLKAALFQPLRDGYMALTVPATSVKQTIYEHPEFTEFMQRMADHFALWRAEVADKLKHLDPKFQPKQLITELSEGLLKHYTDLPLIDPYAIYQILMEYWEDVLQDDAYIVAADGWLVQTHRVIDVDKKTKKQKDKGWSCDLVPKALMIKYYFASHQDAINRQQAELEGIQQELLELEEEHGGEDAAFNGFEKINKAEVTARIKEIGTDVDASDELAVLKRWLALSEREAKLKKAIKTADEELDGLVYRQYPLLSFGEAQVLLVDHKWLNHIQSAIEGEVERVSQQLTTRVRELAERYARPLPEIIQSVDVLERQVQAHLRQMGFRL